MSFLTAIRIMCCLMWATAGFISGGTAGYLSAAASLLFLVPVLTVEINALDKIRTVLQSIKRRQEVSDGWIATGEALDNIGMILGMKRKTFRIMGMARKEPAVAHMRQHMMRIAVRKLTEHLASGQPVQQLGM